jgi:hypothetical protein
MKTTPSTKIVRVALALLKNGEVSAARPLFIVLKALKNQQVIVLRSAAVKSLWDSDIYKVSVISVDKRPGYIIQTELVTDMYGTSFTSKLAYCHDGTLIGSPKDAHYLIDKLGIVPMKEELPNGSKVSIGYSERKRQWFGWSHRAVAGFGIGYVAKSGDCCTVPGVTEEYLKDHPEADVTVPVGFRVRTMADAKRCAIAFAESVS